MKKTIICIIALALSAFLPVQARNDAPGGGVLHAAICEDIDDIAIDPDSPIAELAYTFRSMDRNRHSFGNSWKNLNLGRQAFAMLTDEMPLRYEGELTPYSRIVLLDDMIKCMPKMDCPRFMLKVLEYQESLFSLIGEEDLAVDMAIEEYEGKPENFCRSITAGQIAAQKQKFVDYLDPSITAEQWCDKYGDLLLFDEVERSERWEEVIYKVEKTVARKTRNVRKGMGYCFTYWKIKKKVLARYGIDWRSPSEMNPEVIFD